MSSNMLGQLVIDLKAEINSDKFKSASEIYRATKLKAVNTLIALGFDNGTNKNAPWRGMACFTGMSNEGAIDYLLFPEWNYSNAKTWLNRWREEQPDGLRKAAEKAAWAKEQERKKLIDLGKELAKKLAEKQATAGKVVPPPPPKVEKLPPTISPGVADILLTSVDKIFPVETPSPVANAVVQVDTAIYDEQAAKPVEHIVVDRQEEEKVEEKPTLLKYVVVEEKVTISNEQYEEEWTLSKIDSEMRNLPISTPVEKALKTLNLKLRDMLEDAKMEIQKMRISMADLQAKLNTDIKPKGRKAA